jgi:AraC-like DNA-binding protein
LHEVLGADWQGLANDVVAAGDDAQRIQRIESFLLPLWQAARPPTLPLAPHYLTDWVRSLAMRCAVSSTGKSLRQIERRVKQWTGQTQRQLLRMARGEETYVHVRALRERGDLVWSDVATEKGFSDQSHLCREFRKLTGLQPETVLGNLESDERLWIYRAW